MKRPTLRRPTPDELQYLAMAKTRAERNYSPAKGDRHAFMRRAKDQAVRDVLRRRKSAKKRREVPLEDVRPELATIDPNRRLALLDLVQFLLSQISSESREALILTFLQGLTQREVATMQGVAQEAVSRKVRSGLAQARRLRTTA